MAETAKRDDPAVDRQFTNPTDIAAVGQRIYDERYKAQYEKEYPGQFVAINVRTGEASIGAHPAEAIEAAKKRAGGDGLFHLVRVGSPGAFRVSYSANADQSWFL